MLSLPDRTQARTFYCLCLVLCVCLLLTNLLSLRKGCSEYFSLQINDCSLVHSHSGITPADSNWCAWYRLPLLVRAAYVSVWLCQGAEPLYQEIGFFSHHVFVYMCVYVICTCEYIGHIDECFILANVFMDLTCFKSLSPPVPLAFYSDDLLAWSF